VTDIDGNTYKTIKIGDQWWMAENLKVTHYRNGDEIPYVTDDSEWAGLETGAYCSYNNADSNIAIYGLLYNWYSVDDSQSIAPEGWYVPTYVEWQTLVDYLGGDAVAGGKMKATGTIEGGDGLWHDPNEGATNESGFSALPGGFRYNYGCLGLGESADFWLPLENNYYRALDHGLYFSSSGLHLLASSKQVGLSVRCIRDNATMVESTAPKTIDSPNLVQNYPNPFNPTTTIKYELSSKGKVQIKIFNIYGQLVRELVHDESDPGEYQVTWDGKNDDGQKVTSGTYFYQLRVNDYVFTKKAIFLK